MEHFLGHEWVTLFVKVLVTVLVKDHCGQVDSRTALDLDLFSALNQNFKELNHELASVVKGINHLVHHWLLANNLVQRVKYVVDFLHLQA